MVKISEYVGPAVSVDNIIFQLIDDELAVLLIQRANEPFKGMWALPGGYNPKGETTQEATARILKAKAGIETSRLGFMEQLYTFDTVARDPRGHCISVTYMGLARGLAPKASAYTEHPQFFAVNNLPSNLAYDHGQIIDYAIRRLRRKVSHSNTLYGLLPKLFTLSQLQKAYEAVSGHELDKRNFRKSVMGLGFIKPTNEVFMDGAHRPAKLYKFNQQKVEYISEDLVAPVPQS